MTITVMKLVTGEEIIADVTPRALMLIDSYEFNYPFVIRLSEIAADNITIDFIPYMISRISRTDFTIEKARVIDFVHYEDVHSGVIAMYEERLANIKKMETDANADTHQPT